MRLLLLLCLLLLGILGNTVNITLNGDSVLSRFREQYAKFTGLVQEALVDPPDVFLLEMLGEELGEFQTSVIDVQFYFV